MPGGTRRRGRRSRTCTRAVARESATNATRDPRRRRLPSRDGAKRPRRARRSSLRRHRLGHGCRLATRFHRLQNARPRSHDAAPAAIDSADLVEARADGLRGEMPSPKLWERQRHHAFSRNNRPAAFEHGRAAKRVSCLPRDQGAHAARGSRRAKKFDGLTLSATEPAGDQQIGTEGAQRTARSPDRPSRGLRCERDSARMPGDRVWDSTGRAATLETR